MTDRPRVPTGAVALTSIRRATRARRVTAGLALLGLALVATGCSDDGEDATDASAPATVESTSTSSSTTTTSLPEPLADQTPPRQANGITVDGASIWVADFAEDIVIQVDRESGAILRRLPAGGASPDDVALDADGTVWASGLGSGDLGRVGADGYEAVVPVAPGINGIAAAPDGTVYVATATTLYRYDPSRDAVELVVEGLPDINAFGVLADGRILAPGGGVAGPGQAVLIDPDSGTFEVIVEGLPGVAAATTDADGTPYLLANVTGEVLRVDVEAGTVETVRTVAEGTPFDNLAFAADGTLYLSSFTAGSLTEVAPDGTVRTIPIGTP